jgi:hypothetical protein
MPKNSFQAVTSTTSNSIASSGQKTWTLAASAISDATLSAMYPVGAPVYISGNTAGTAENWMIGRVNSLNTGTRALVVDIDRSAGSGTLTNWSITFAPQSMYLVTGTSSNNVLKEFNPVFATPASAADSIREILSDVKAAPGSLPVNNIVSIKQVLFSKLTPDANTIYIISDTGSIYLGSSIIGKPKSRTMSGTSDTLLRTDNGNYIYYTSNSAVTLTVPNNLPADFTCLIIQQGSGQVTFSAASGTTLVNYDSHTKTAGQKAIATLIITSNTDGVSASGNFFGKTA